MQLVAAKTRKFSIDGVDRMESTFLGIKNINRESPATIKNQYTPFLADIGVRSDLATPIYTVISFVRKGDLIWY